jgi:3',5'-cyclic AMP phosphodiesterase CpdA
MSALRRIAHLSDLHLLAKAQRQGLGVRFVSMGRALDVESRVAKLRRAVRAATRAGADHFVLSGDLTETGTDEQFETLAEALAEAGLDPDRTTLVPGNHDAYADGGAFRRALEGPLRAYRAHAAVEPGKVVERGGVFFLPVDVTIPQRVTTSRGELRADVARALRRRLADRALRRGPAVLVQHHPPFPHASSLLQWIDGLRGWARAMDLLLRHANLHVLHGHLHRSVDRVVERITGRTRVFGAPAVVDDGDAPRVRLYEVRGRELEAVGVVG